MPHCAPRQVALGPLGVVYTAILIVTVPELSRIYVRNPARMPRVANLVAAVSAASAVVVGAIVFFLPDSIGTALLGENWFPAHTVIVPSALGLAFSALMTGPFLQMRCGRGREGDLQAPAVAAHRVGRRRNRSRLALGCEGCRVAVAVVIGVFVWLSWLQAGPSSRRVMRFRPTRPRCRCDDATGPGAR